MDVERDILSVRRALQQVLSTELSPVVAQYEAYLLSMRWAVADSATQTKVIEKLRADLEQLTKGANE